jgi:hypothetical protein
MISSLLVEALQEQKERRRRGLSRKEMFENGIHEAGHATVAVRLRLGPLPAGIKLWRHGCDIRGTAEFCWGVTHLCRWVEADGVVRQEIENSIVTVMAGRFAQYRTTNIYREQSWTATPALYAMELEMTDAWSQDDALIAELLSYIPLRSGEAITSARTSLEDRTQRLLDENWSAVLAVARSVLNAKHYLLEGRVVTKIVNREMKTDFSTVKKCQCANRNKRK